MKTILMMIAIVGLCVGCETLSTVESITNPSGSIVNGTPNCSHEGRKTYAFDDFVDGHHYLFKYDYRISKGKSKTLAASVNVKDGFLEGPFEIYYDTGVFKYKGMLDNRGHVVSGKYNDFELKLHDWDVRDMTTADMQNAQAELVDIMQYGFREDEKVVQPLFNYIHSEFHPNAGTIYRHDGRYLKVFQVIDGAVMVSVEMGAPAWSSFGQLDFIVETSRKYVDGEMLAPGKYKYIGPYTYETVREEKRTIRHFKEVE